MSPDKIIISLLGLLSVGFVAWFFFGKKSFDSAQDYGLGTIDIKVSGGYEPSTIILKKGKKTIINFLRTDPSDCLEEVVLSDFKIRKKLPLNEKVSIAITPQKTGEFDFSCGMGMFHGKLIVR